MRGIADEMGVPDSYRSTDVAVFVGTPGAKVSDPYFGGAGPDRTGCVECGACMIGCRHNAKNTLDRNYLYLAEANGATVHPCRQVVDVVPLPAGGYEITSERSGAWLRKNRQKSEPSRWYLRQGCWARCACWLACRKLAGFLISLNDSVDGCVRTQKPSSARRR